MKALPTLIALSLLATSAALWILPQGVSQATNRTPADAPVSVTISAVTTHAAAPAPAPVTLSVKPVSERQRALQAAFEGDDLCEAARLLGEASNDELYGAFLGAVEPAGEALELYGPDGPMLAAKGDATRKYKSLAARTAWALKVGGVGFFPVTAGGSDPAAGRELLLELEKQDPGNAFYPLFRLVLESRLGYTNDRLKATAETAAGGTFLDSHLRAVEQELDEGSWRNSSLRYARTNFQSALNVPYYDATSVLKRLEKDAGFSGNGRIAALLAEEAAHADRGPDDDGFDMNRYYAANNLDGKQIEDMDKLLSRHGWKFGDGFPNLFHVDAGKQTCEPAAYEERFAEALGRR